MNYIVVRLPNFFVYFLTFEILENSYIVTRKNKKISVCMRNLKHYNLMYILYF